MNRTRIPGPVQYPAFYLLAQTGMRPGEVNGLKWENVNLETGMLNVVVGRTMAGADIVERPPKTKSGRRVIGLDGTTVAVLREWNQTQELERAYAAEAWTESGYVFTDQMGQPNHPLKLSDLWPADPFNQGQARHGSTAAPHHTPPAL